MTPFDSWYSSTIAPQLEETLKNIPAPARDPLRKASRESMAACWNAALDAAMKYDCGDTMDPVDYEPIKVRVTL